MENLANRRETGEGYASLSLYRGDRMRLLGFPLEIYQVVRDVVESCWPGGVQREKDKAGLREMKLGGYPWHGLVPSSCSYDPSASMWLMSRVFERLFNAGWRLIQRTCLGWELDDIDVFLFRGVDAPRPHEWMAVDIALGRCMLVRAPGDIVQAVSDLFPTQEKSVWPTYYSISLPCLPDSFKDKSTSLGMKCSFWILRAAEEHGWSLYAAVKHRGVDSWHFCRGPATHELENPFDTTSENIILNDEETTDLVTPCPAV
ncbi:hypothetical protein F4775DRAFT_596739 [Biscogniauxia sp. FL1348]|nr:hypothetical protein F4775DRAFT_587331 [Biscogniauxia sp. FL1348]KAI0593942.1 hypothetical protein F4775DRAFT_596739 [Biscogniauxia sp. FL1348]